MICPQCNIDRKVEDFLGKQRCYKCIYQEKIKTRFPKKCPLCSKDVLDKGCKYCSDECAYEANLIKKREYWTKKVLREHS